MSDADLSTEGRPQIDSAVLDPMALAFRQSFTPASRGGLRERGKPSPIPLLPLK
jgi:hypothetical protein